MPASALCEKFAAEFLTQDSRVPGVRLGTPGRERLARGHLSRSGWGTRLGAEAQRVYRRMHDMGRRTY